MLNEKQIIQRCKAIVRGSIEGDKTAALLILTKLNVSVSESVKKRIKVKETADMTKLSKAAQLYLNLESFVARDRYSIHDEAVPVATKLVDSVNRLQPKAELTVSMSVDAWLYEAGRDTYKYKLGKYTKEDEKGLYKFIYGLYTPEVQDYVKRVFEVLEPEQLN